MTIWLVLGGLGVVVLACGGLVAWALVQVWRWRHEADLGSVRDS